MHAPPPCHDDGRAPEAAPPVPKRLLDGDRCELLRGLAVEIAMDVDDLADDVVRDEQRRDSRDSDYRRTDSHRRDEAVDVRLRVEVRAVGREHGRENRDAEDATDL